MSPEVDLATLSHKELLDRAFGLQELSLSYLPLPQQNFSRMEQAIWGALREERAASMDTMLMVVEQAQDKETTEASVNSTVANMRRKLRESQAPWAIASRWGGGWYLERLEERVT